MKADYVHKDSLTSTDYVNLQKENELIINYNQQLLKEKQQLKERIAYLERSIERKDDTIIELEQERVPYTNKYIDEIKKENEDLKRQLNYLRSGEYYNQLRFENQMLQDVVDNGEVSKKDRAFIYCTHRNTELVEQQLEFIDYLEDEKDRLASEVSDTYEDDLGKTRLINEDIFNEVNKIELKYKEIIGELHD